MIFSGVHFFLKNVDDLFSRRPNTQFPQKMTSDSAWDALTTYHYKLCQNFSPWGARAPSGSAPLAMPMKVEHWTIFET